MKNNRLEAKLGVLAFAVYLVINRFVPDWDFVKGALCGFAIVLLLISALPESAYKNIKALKAKLRKQ